MANIKTFYKNIYAGTFEKDKSIVKQALLNFTVMIVFSAVFGVVVGSYEPGLQTLYAAVKVPLLLVITVAIMTPFMLITGLILEGKAKLSYWFQLINFGLTQTAIMLLALIPLMWVFIQSGDYRLSILCLTLCYMIAGAFTIFRINKPLREHLKANAFRVFLITAAWAIVCTFTGGQIWWLMRPWVGYTYQQRDLPFIRPLTEDEISNVYESIQLTGTTWYERNIAVPEEL